MNRTIAFGAPLLGAQEKAAVMAVLSQPVLVHGPKAADFESDFCEWTGAKHATSVSSCTAALHLVYFHSNIKGGDEVIVPAQTHNATAHAVELCGAKPVFVDAEEITGNINIDLIEQAITPRTKAISVVHYLGMPVDMARINELARKHGLFTVEDCALAMGTRLHGKHAGTLGDFGAFSFYPVKHMTTAEGGMLIAKEASDFEAIKRKKAFGVDRTAGERQIPGVYDVTMLGFNYRMSEIHAALGIEQLRRMNDFLQLRRKNYERLASGLKDVSGIDLLVTEKPGFECSWYCLSAILSPALAKKRIEIIEILREKGIGTSVYYPHPVPKLKYYKDKYSYPENSFPVASRLSYDSIALPVGPHLNEDDMDWIVAGMKQAVSQVK